MKYVINNQNYRMTTKLLYQLLKEGLLNSSKCQGNILVIQYYLNSLEWVKRLRLWPTGGVGRLTAIEGKLKVL